MTVAARHLASCATMMQCTEQQLPPQAETAHAALQVSEVQKRVAQAARAEELDKRAERMNQGFVTGGQEAWRASRQFTPPLDLVQQWRTVPCLSLGNGEYETADATAFAFAIVIQIDSEEVHLIAISQDKVQLSCTVPCGECEIQLLVSATNIDDSIKMLSGAWLPIWQSGKSIPSSVIQRLLAESGGFAPLPQVGKPLDQCDVQSTISRMDESAAGTDGWRPRELKLLPPWLIFYLTLLLNMMAEQCCWIEESNTGIVNMIAKKLDSVLVKDCRPIVILTTLYRVWSSSHAAAILAAWTPWLPRNLTGGIRGRAANDVWARIQWKVDVALLTGVHINGAVLDLVKAFNHIPRNLVWQLLKYLGVHPHLRKAWEAYLLSLRRWFRVAGHLGEPSTSDTGFPEGDPLSVIAMLVVSHLFAQSIEATDSAIQVDTYADNWEWTCDNVPSNESALLWVARFAQDLMMPVAWEKV